MDLVGQYGIIPVLLNNGTFDDTLQGEDGSKFCKKLHVIINDEYTGTTSYDQTDGNKDGNLRLAREKEFTLKSFHIG